MKQMDTFTHLKVDDFSFEVYYKNKCTAKVYSKGSEVFVESNEKNPVKRLFPKMQLTRYQVNKILETRCWDKGRPDIKDLLKAVGLKEYVPLDIVRKTHGVSWNDFIWIKFPGENLKAEDVLVRKDWINNPND